MTDFIQEIPQPRRRIVKGERKVGSSLRLCVEPSDCGSVRLSVRNCEGALSPSDGGGFFYNAQALRDLAASLTEIADVLEQEQ